MLSPFEYVTVLISIILGLGITQIVTGIADIIHSWERIKLYWPHILWIILVFFLHIQEWWAIYDLRHYDSWQLPTFLFISLYPINLFILARILFPISSTDSEVNYKEFYYASFPKFFLGIIILSVLAMLDNLFISDLGVEGILLPMVILIGLGVVAMKQYRQEWLHKLIVLLMVLIMVVSLSSHMDIAGLAPIK